MGSIRDIIDNGKKKNEEWASRIAKEIIESEIFLDNIRQAVEVSLSSVEIEIIEDYCVTTDEEIELIKQNMISILDAEDVSIDKFDHYWNDQSICNFVVSLSW